ncbi:MAG: M14 family zinc carboxypeptidase [Armatimonadia bacterium]
MYGDEILLTDCRLKLIAALGLALLCLRPCGADIVSDICARHGGEQDSFERVLGMLRVLDNNPRVTMRSIGTTAQGRPIPLVVVHDPTTPLEGKVRVFVIARQHGTESSGTAACLALARHFAQSEGQLERDLRRQMALVMVPVANPDGMCASKRRNGGGSDLNRDWAAFAQPETRAIAAAVKHYKPYALIDMHELPASSSKAVYQESFIETIGKDSRLPQDLSVDCMTTSSHLARWMKQSGMRLNVYYDGVSDNTLLCHRYFGLRCGIPAYLFEAKCGAGRTLAQRMRFQVLGALVVANYALHRYYVPREGPDEAAGTVLAEKPAVPEAAEELRLRMVRPVGEEPARGQLPVEAEVTGLPEGGYLLFHVDGTLKALTNAAPHVYFLDTPKYSDGQHTVRVEACSASGQTLAASESVIMVDNTLAAGE